MIGQPALDNGTDCVIAFAFAYAAACSSASGRSPSTPASKTSTPGSRSPVRALRNAWTLALKHIQRDRQRVQRAPIGVRA